MNTQNSMSSEELVARLIEDVKKFIILEVNTKNMDEVMAQMSAYAANPNVNKPAINEEFVIASFSKIEIPGDISSVASILNASREFFTLNNERVTDARLFLKELEEKKEDVSQLITKLKDKIFVDLSTRQQGTLPYDFLRDQMEHLHHEVSVAFTHYTNINEKEKTQ